MFCKCEYCNSENSIHSKLALFDYDLDLGVLGKSRLAMYISHYDYGSFLTLNMNNDGWGGTTVRKVSRVIYCPQCGRKLED
ncbi:MAG: hypothetical protein J6N21_15005 [Butyrivibrio sp.]|nr:hypothetical protein [Butyrivibrio sp.]